MSVNRAFLMGRIASDLELTSTVNGDVYVCFALAVDDEYKKPNEEKPHTNFLQCQAWCKTAEFIVKYFHKGALIHIEARARQENYESKKYNATLSAVRFVVEKANFTGEKSTANSSGNRNDTAADVPPPPEPPEQFYGGSAADDDYPF